MANPKPWPEIREFHEQARIAALAMIAALNTSRGCTRSVLSFCRPSVSAGCFWFGYSHWKRGRHFVLAVGERMHWKELLSTGHFNTGPTDVEPFGKSALNFPLELA
jgi:hypothetical protein